MTSSLNLIFLLARREIEARYRGSSFGLLWALFYPVATLSLYTLVFGVFFRSRWPGFPGADGSAEFAVIVFGGMIMHGFLAECLVKAPGLILSNPNYVKKVVFPLEALAWVQVLAASFFFCINFAVYLAFHCFAFGLPSPMLVFLPVLFLPLVLVGVGVLWMVGSLAVFFRDLAQVIGFVVMVFFFMSPVLYPLESVPEAFRTVMGLNPLTAAIDGFRDIALYGRLPSLSQWAMHLFAAGLFALLARKLFQRLRGTFSDAL